METGLRSTKNNSLGPSLIYMDFKTTCVLYAIRERTVHRLNWDLIWRSKFEFQWRRKKFSNCRFRFLVEWSFPITDRNNSIINPLIRFFRKFPLESKIRNGIHVLKRSTRKEEMPEWIGMHSVRQVQGQFFERCFTCKRSRFPQEGLNSVSVYYVRHISVSARIWVCSGRICLHVFITESRKSGQGEMSNLWTRKVNPPRSLQTRKTPLGAKGRSVGKKHEAREREQSGMSDPRDGKKVKSGTNTGIGPITRNKVKKSTAAGNRSWRGTKEC